MFRKPDIIFNQSIDLLHKSGYWFLYDVTSSKHILMHLKLGRNFFGFILVSALLTWNNF